MGYLVSFILICILLAILYACLDRTPKCCDGKDHIWTSWEEYAFTYQRRNCEYCGYIQQRDVEKV